MGKVMLSLKLIKIYMKPFRPTYHSLPQVRCICEKILKNECQIKNFDSVTSLISVYIQSEQFCLIQS